MSYRVCPPGMSWSPRNIARPQPPGHAYGLRRAPEFPGHAFGHRRQAATLTPQLPMMHRPGRGVMFPGLGDGEGLGFSLKRPKWLRKMQPGKVLAKVALPAAAVAATFLIPGVGGAIVKGATLAAKGVSKLVPAIGRGTVATVKAVPGVVSGAAGIIGTTANTVSQIPGVIPTLTPASSPPFQATTGPVVTYPPQTPIPMDYSSGGGGGASGGSYGAGGGGMSATQGSDSTAVQAAGMAGAMPDWVIPVGIGAAALLLLNRRR